MEHVEIMLKCISHYKRRFAFVIFEIVLLVFHLNVITILTARCCMLSALVKHFNFFFFYYLHIISLLGVCSGVSPNVTV